MSNLTDIEMSVLKLCDRYGVDLNLSGPRITRTVKAAARELLRKGYLTGEITHLQVTVRGAAALPEEEPYDRDGYTSGSNGW